MVMFHDSMPLLVPAAEKRDLKEANLAGYKRPQPQVMKWKSGSAPSNEMEIEKSFEF